MAIPRTLKQFFALEEGRQNDEQFILQVVKCPKTGCGEYTLSWTNPTQPSGKLRCPTHHDQVMDRLGNAYRGAGGKYHRHK